MTEEEMIKAICSSASEQNRALRALYITKGTEFKRYFKYKGVAEDATEDLLQEVILKIFKSADKFLGESTKTENTANSWMWAIARNAMNDYFSKSNKKTGVEKSSSEIEEVEKNKIIINLKREEAIKNRSSNSEDKITKFPYIKPIEKQYGRSEKFSGSLNDEDWLEKNQRILSKSEMAVFNENAARELEIQIEECVVKGLEEFCAEEPDRAKVIYMKIDGQSIESIAITINRTKDAAKQYLSQCRKKLAPYISHCLKIKYGNEL